LTTVIVIILCFIFRTNFIAAQVSNLLVTPLNLALFIPLIALGDELLHSPTLPASTDVLVTQLKSNLLGFVKTFYVAIFHGIFAWAVVTPPITYLLYKLILVMIRPLYKNKV